MKCLPSIIIKPLAIALDDAATFRQVRRLVVKQMHNVVIGMMDGDKPEQLYIIQNQETNNEQNNSNEDQDMLTAAKEAWQQSEKRILGSCHEQRNSNRCQG